MRDNYSPKEAHQRKVFTSPWWKSGLEIRAAGTETLSGSLLASAGSRRGGSDMLWFVAQENHLPSLPVS